MDKFELRTVDQDAVRVGVAVAGRAGGGSPLQTAVHVVTQLLDLQVDVAAVQLHQLHSPSLDKKKLLISFPRRGIFTPSKNIAALNPFK